MNWMFYGFSFLGITSLLTELFLIVFWKKNKIKRRSGRLPKVSVLVAARNEEENIAKCLDSLLLLDYPTDKLEILVGNDASTDRTEEILAKYVEKHDQISTVNITSQLGRAAAKANVLAHLAKAASGEYFFITDADIQVSYQWVKGLLAHQKEGDGIVSGITMVTGDGWWEKFQNIEWLNALGMVKVVTDMKIPVTAIGNNMMVTRAAYESIGGYENIKPSIVEDFQLTKEVVKKGYTISNVVDETVLATTVPPDSLPTFLNQRKRWMQGTFQLPFLLICILSIQAMTIPIMIGMLFFSFEWAILYFLVKLILRIIYNRKLFKSVNQKTNFVRILLYEFYTMGITFLMMLFYLLPGKIDWKGRRY